MNWLAPKLHLRVAQKQILTPGLVQMVSVLALNRLELREMINQEIMANPVLEEVAEEDVTAESYTDEAFLKKETEKVPENRSRESLRRIRFWLVFSRNISIPARSAPQQRTRGNRKAFVRQISLFCLKPCRSSGTGN